MRALRAQRLPPHRPPRGKRLPDAMTGEDTPASPTWAGAPAALRPGAAGRRDIPPGGAGPQPRTPHPAAPQPRSPAADAPVHTVPRTRPGTGGRVLREPWRRTAEPRPRPPWSPPSPRSEGDEARQDPRSRHRSPGPATPPHSRARSRDAPHTTLPVSHRKELRRRAQVSRALRPRPGPASPGGGHLRGGAGAVVRLRLSEPPRKTTSRDS